MSKETDIGINATLHTVFFPQQLILVLTKHDIVSILVLIISSSRHERRPIRTGKRMLAAKPSESLSTGQGKLTPSDNHPDNTYACTQNQWQKLISNSLQINHYLG